MSARILRRDTAGADDMPDTMPALLKRIYAGRGVRDAAGLELGLERLIPVRELGSIDTAVALLLKHFHSSGRITVIGDFDADGATSTALMVRQLRRLGFADVDFLVPNRFEYGYGLTPEIVALAAGRQPALIITVDNGISSHAGVEAATLAGIETLITDHHLPAATLPAAAVIVNPNSPGETFASKALAGVGVAFYLMAALTREMQEQGLVAEPKPVADLLDLVALGTVADLVALDHNNRILVHQGLRRIRAGRCTAGIRALLEVAGKRLDKVVASDLGFQVGPRLNAAGRLDDMTIGIQCLLTDDAVGARLLAGRLAQLNQDRKELELRMQQEALGTLADMRADDDSLPLGLCLFEEDWHQGVVGLVASRVKERTHRPVIAFARADGAMLKGSARSVPGVHIRDVLDAVATRNPALIHRFGGHAMAAGLTLAAEHLDAFRAAFDTEVRRWMTADDAHGVIHSDGALASQDFTLETARVVREAGPWGQAFPEPTFDGRFSVVETRILGDRHLKLKLRAGSEQGRAGALCEAIAFRYFDHADAADVSPGQRVEIAFRMDVNEYAGIERLQLLIEHLALAE
jgi:single-stranded-DNA-specific exonuclease